MTPVKPLVALGAVAALSLSLAACGGGSSSAPTDASKADFCSAYKSGDDAFSKVGSTDYDGAAKALHAVADKLKDTGTPSDIPADARDGFEGLVKLADGISADKLKSASEKMKEALTSGKAPSSADDVMAGVLGISAAEVKKIEAFTAWADKEC